MAIEREDIGVYASVVASIVLPPIVIRCAMLHSDICGWDGLWLGGAPVVYIPLACLLGAGFLIRLKKRRSYWFMLGLFFAYLPLMYLLLDGIPYTYVRDNCPEVFTLNQ